MRNILNLFEIKYPSFEVVMIGYLRLIIASFDTIKQLLALIKYATVTNSFVLMVKSLEEAYDINELVLTCYKQIIIIIYH